MGHENSGKGSPVIVDPIPVQVSPKEVLRQLGHPDGADVPRAFREKAEAGITELVPVIDNGSDAPGTILPDCSPEFRARFDRAGLVISKGQGNYETLSDVAKPVFFLLRVKCPVIAQDVGCPVGTLVLRKKGG